MPPVSAVFACVAVLIAAPCGGVETLTASASTSARDSNPNSAVDGNRFSLASAWKGDTNATQWWWQVKFEAEREVGTILQIVGDHDFVLRNAPSQSVWQRSDDGLTWSDLRGTAVTNDGRLFRIHRLSHVVRARYLRFNITAVTGQYPTLREVEFYSETNAPVPFPDWIIAVNTTHDSALPNHGQEFIPLAKSCSGWEELQAQQVWLGSFNEQFLRIEPRPLCGFLSGNFKDWCEVDRENWRGTQEVLRNKNLPIWASCGGAQGLAILAETGVDKPWDCPHCREPQNPRTPIYTHIGHTAERPCGDYSGCIFERGLHWVRVVTDDPVFKNLPQEFQVMQSHCGQIEWPPSGWSLIATAGQGSRTKTQCLRMNDRYIYAAQFHIEMKGAPVASEQIMGNFLGLAKAWGGYKAKPIKQRTIPSGRVGGPASD